jgi:hypothetical protein
VRLLEPDPPARLGWRILGDTTEGAIIVASAKAGVDLAAASARAPRIGEFPFDSGRKLMTTLHRTQAGCVSYVKGSPQELLGRCAAVSWDGADIPLTEHYRGLVIAADDQLAGEALRVLAVAPRQLDTDRPSQDAAEHDLTLLGLVAMMDPPRPEVAAAVAACRHAGIRIIMVTGDYGVTARHATCGVSTQATPADGSPRYEASVTISPKSPASTPRPPCRIRPLPDDPARGLIDNTEPSALGRSSGPARRYAVAWSGSVTWRANPDDKDGSGRACRPEPMGTRPAGVFFRPAELISGTVCYVVRLRTTLRAPVSAARPNTS